jgi:membrane-bound serine protease (ClpP class)
MTGWLIFAIFLYFLSAALIVAEVFIPSGGVLGGLSFLCLLGGIYIFFDHSAAAGIIGVIIAVIMIPLVLILSYKTLPRTRFGKSVILNPSSMLNQTGIVMTDLRPVGMVDFSGKRIECVAETGYIAKDTKVTVIKVQSTQLTVRQVEES